MAMSQLGLVLVALLALVATGTVALNMAREVRMGMAWLGAVLWGVLGLSAFDVHAQAWSGARPMLPVAYLGLGFAMLVAVVALFQTAKLLEERGATTPFSEVSR